MPWRKAWGLTRETLPVMLCALAGLLLSGMELDHMTTWKTFAKVDKFLILVPIMLNLYVWPQLQTLGKLTIVGHAS